jgi:hypothetical protein
MAARLRLCVIKSIKCAGFWGKDVRVEVGFWAENAHWEYDWWELTLDIERKMRVGSLEKCLKV